jgi:two-component system nitrogen regulation response regulator GlnG
MHKVLVVDDEESVRYSFRKTLREPAYQVLDAADGTEALAAVRRAEPDLVILDIEMPGMSGLEVLAQLRSIAPKLPVLVITAHGDSDRVIAAMKHGAFEYIEKPFDIPRLKALIEDALEVGRLMRAGARVEPLVPHGQAAARIIGNSSAMQEVCKMIGRVAASDVTVLLVGESGTGKELVARAIHQHGQAGGAPFLAVNCAAIPETLLESELFGYERGAFTGAFKRRVGKFELADGGTLFLDEIGDMSQSTQAKVLRVLQEGTFERLGGEETIRVRVKVIAATNRNLEEAIAAKAFREDLYYRLKVITITLPPLRVRKEDLPELTQHFVAKFCAQTRREPVAVAPEAMQAIQDHDWPGNVRELENALKRAILLCHGNVIRALDVAPAPRSAAPPTQAPPEDPRTVRVPADLERYDGRLYDAVTSELERKLIVAALGHARGNQVLASRLLGISRVMLHDRMKKYGIKAEITITGL